MEWQPMATAPKDGARVHARDVDGNEQVTWFCDGDWVYAGWRETEDRDEYETEEWWEPTEWMPRQARSNALAQPRAEAEGWSESAAAQG